MSHLLCAVILLSFLFSALSYAHNVHIQLCSTLLNVAKFLCHSVNSQVSFPTYSVRRLSPHNTGRTPLSHLSHCFCWRCVLINVVYCSPVFYFHSLPSWFWPSSDFICCSLTVCMSFLFHLYEVLFSLQVLTTLTCHYTPTWHPLRRPWPHRSQVWRSGTACGLKSPSPTLSLVRKQWKQGSRE